MKIFAFKVKADPRGSLVAIEQERDIPFEIKRVYYMYNIYSNAVRGCHAHKKLKQVIICLHGKCSVLLDNGYNKEKVELSDPFIGLYIAPEVWHEIYECSQDSVIISLASDYYDENDYIRNYNDFIDYIKYSNEEARL